MTSPTQRPTFLTVLCILSFLGGLWGVVEGYRTGFTDKPQQDLLKAQEGMEEAMAMMGDGGGFAQRVLEEGIVMAEMATDHARTLGISGLLLSLIGLYGVWLMWNLRRNGFWIYSLASVGGLLVPLAVLGFSMITLLGLGFGGFVTVLFIILYAVNLKHMA